MTVCQEHTICFELMKGVPSAIVAVVVAIASWIIASEQIRVAKGKLNLDLFQERYALFNLMWSHLSDMTRGPTNRRHEVQVDFRNSVPKLEFLCGSTMAEYAKLVIRHVAEYESIESSTRANGGVMRQEHIDRHTELMKWFYDEATEGLRRRFAEFLDFEKWR
ncbi:hypothetical protein [Burkholderia glumae]|uniref:hypothetical protein n=1 Tax=Burkholderia glumae TaxID=337 RepID=UPI0012FD081C|nr:hypothetical protein [Burkholderia glumae]MCM2540385.1 hypothetical protein [Burkholderia glumae]QHE10237.1 hypothetical protein GQR88_07330 [Burkholderia glumae AU6208]